MNKFKKFLIGIMVAASAACLCGAVACNGSDGGSTTPPGEIQTDPPAYYKLDLKGSGVDIVFEGDLAEDENGESFRFGGTVKEGVEVRFKVLPGANITGTPVIDVNGTRLTPDADGVYSFTMQKDSEIAVTGLSALHTLTFSTFEEVIGSDGNGYLEERRIKYLDETGTKELDEEVTVVNGQDFKFRIWTSPYYNDEFTVSCGFEELVKDENGVYTIREVGESGEIDVTGLTLQESFANFEDGRYGDGSAEHPYELRKPVDLYYLAVMINDDYYGGRFASLNYKLMADIDMDGEQLFVIGDSSTSYSAFCGTFDGNGHKISNFYITDEVFDQSSYTREYLPYVGLFGYAVATVDSNNNIVAPVIKNLTLEDYSLEIHTASSGAGAYAGSLLGYGIGVEITGCKAISGTGSITVINDNNQIVNVGGLVGRLQGAYGSTAQGNVARGAFVRSSSAIVSMHGTGCPRAAGGIVGYLISAEENAIGYVVNCYSKGTVSGAMHSGGIVGTLGRYSSVSNSYSSAEVSADNRLGGLNVTPEYMGAYAGGIVGYAEENTVIAGCYAANYTSASVNSLTAYSVNGANYMKTGAFAGDYAKPNPNSADDAVKFSTDYDVLVEYNNSTAVANHPKSAFTALGWVDSEWSFSGTVPLPEIVVPSTVREVTVRLEQYNNPSYTRSFRRSAVAPLSDWYSQTAEGSLPEYHENAAGRSWGYYFDKEMTQKVPYGFVPVMAETTLYAGYADYNEVAGTYYVGEEAYSNGAYIVLTADGKAMLRNGGLYYECTYSYTGSANGAKIVLYRSCLAALAFGEEEINGGYFAYGGTAANGALSLSSYLMLVNPEGSLETGDYYVYQTATVSAVKAAENFVYGEYKDANGVRYLFRKNGTGVRTTDNSTASFTFTPAANSFNIMLDRAVAVKVNPDGTVDTINDVSVSVIDEFKGSWKKTANGLTEFNFDGEGFVSMNGGEAVAYTADGGFEIDGVPYKATFANGALVINGENYYKNDGFTGEWFMLGSKEQIQVTFDGIGTDGYGTATINYSGGESATVEAQYDVVEASNGKFLRLYVDDRQYGELLFNESGKSASGSFYSWLYERYDNFTFYLYDLFRGSWTAAGDDFDTVTFNGRSASASNSEVAVRAAGAAPVSGTYALTDSTHGTMTVGGKTYSIVYDGETNLITFAYQAEGETPVNGQLGRRDGWYGAVLTDGTLTYSFDGKSNVGGKVKVSDNTEYEYTIEGGAVTMNGTALTPDNDGFDWGGTSLKFNTGFAGEWLISGVDNVLTIKEVSGFMTADVTATGVSGTKKFAFDPAANTLTLTEGETVTLIKLMGSYEMSVSIASPDGNKYYNCLKSDRADSWKGVYTAEDGSSWKFDGLGNCRYGGGTAIFTPATGEAVKYGYRINELGLPYIRATENAVFTEDAEGAYENGGKKYSAVTVNSYYGRTVFTDVTGGGRTSYLFDGVSTLWERRSDGTYAEAYTYEIITSATAELIKDGVRYNGLMEEAGMSIRLTVNEQVKATADGTTYSFGVRTLWAVDSDGAYTSAYTYVVTDEKNKEYELTDKDGKKFTAKLISGDEGNTLEIAEKEENTEQA